MKINNIKVAVWKDGYWDKDLDTAQEIDAIDGYGCGDHYVLEVPEDAKEAEVQNIVELKNEMILNNQEHAGFGGFQVDLFGFANRGVNEYQLAAKRFMQALESASATEDEAQKPDNALFWCVAKMSGEGERGGAISSLTFSRQDL